MSTTYDSADALPTDLSTTPYEALRDRFAILAHIVDIVSVERKALWAEISRREREVAILLRLGGLTAEQKEEYKAIINSPSFDRNA